MRIELKLLEGREHYVCPVVMAVEGVLNGSNGALFYPADELRKSVSQWNGRPVVIFHPDMYVSSLAGNPAIFNKQKVGTLFNAKFEKNALKAEAWLDPERLKTVDKRVLEAIQNKQMVEVSTGVIVELEEKSGTFNARSYIAIARNYKPDHLALLPDKIGASSIADGAGLMRNVAEGETALRMPTVWG